MVKFSVYLNRHVFVVVQAGLSLYWSHKSYYRFHALAQQKQKNSKIKNKSRNSTMITKDQNPGTAQ